MLWDADAKPAIPRMLWHRAVDFSKLFGTDKVAEVLHQGQMYYVCKARLAGAIGESDRAPVTEEVARKWLLLHTDIALGNPVQYAHLRESLAFHVFWHGATTARDQCICWSFPEKRRCKHVLALGIHTRRQLPPPEIDPALVCPRRAGRPKSTGKWGVKEDDAVAEGAAAAGESDLASMWEQLGAFAAPQPQQKKRRLRWKQPAVVV